MTNYIGVSFPELNPDQSSMLIAQLNEAGYEGFEETETGLKAYIPEQDFDREFIQNLAFKYQYSFSLETIAEQNWNALWESNFSPVIVDDFVGIRADFHSPLPGLQHEIIITPKMSFGTGHHATTCLMIEAMRVLDFNGKSVLDFGTGTGVLAILAEKLGAATVKAIDNDDWSILNTRENVSTNHCNQIEIVQDDKVPQSDSFDIILANINKHVIQASMQSFRKTLKPGGILVLSGLLTTDEKDITEIAQNNSFVKVNNSAKNNWISLVFSA